LLLGIHYNGGVEIHLVVWDVIATTTKVTKCK